MIKHFCDRCDQPGSITNQVFNSSGLGTLGLQVILMSDGRPSPDHHVCQNCLAELVMDVVRTAAPDAPAFVVYNEADKAVAERDKLRRHCDELRTSESGLVESNTILRDRIAELEKKSRADEAKISLLDTKLNKAYADADSLFKRMKAERTQDGVDREASPDYVEAVIKNQAKRAGART